MPDEFEPCNNLDDANERAKQAEAKWEEYNSSRCPECHHALSCCGPMTDNGPETDCMVCLLSSQLTAVKEELEEVVNAVVANGGITESTPKSNGVHVSIEPTPSEMVTEVVAQLAAKTERADKLQRRIEKKMDTSFEYAEVTKERLELGIELDRLRKFFPKTKDGVIVTPGMELWERRQGVAVARTIKAFEIGRLEDGLDWVFSQYYSTLEAARRGIDKKCGFTDGDFVCVREEGHPCCCKNEKGQQFAK